MLMNIFVLLYFLCQICQNVGFFLSCKKSSLTKPRRRFSVCIRSSAFLFGSLNLVIRSQSGHGIQYRWPISYNIYLILMHWKQPVPPKYNVAYRGTNPSELIFKSWGLGSKDIYYLGSNI